MDAGPIDAVPDAPVDAVPDAPVDAPPDAAPPDAPSIGTSATTIGIDPAHDNAQPTDSVASPLTPLWSSTFSGAVSYPLVSNEIVFVAIGGAQSTVRALDIRTGASVWGPVTLGIRVMLAYDRGRVFALDQNGILTALDAMTGVTKWAVQLQGQPFYQSPPVASGGVVYINGVGSGGTTLAINELNGAVRWTQGTGGTDGCVAVANGVVYESEPCDHMWAWDALTGVRLWNRGGNCIGGGGQAPSVYGTSIWERDASGGNVIVDHAGNALGTFPAYPIPAFHAGTAFYVFNGSVMAVDIATTTLRWTFTPPTADGQLCTSAVVAGGGGQVFVGAARGKMYELDEITGVQRSVHDIGTALTCFAEDNSMALADGHLLVPVGNELVVY